VGTIEKLRGKYKVLLPALNEQQKRLMAAADAQILGRGGISLVCRASGISRPTIYKGLEILQRDDWSDERIRKIGGGRKKLTATNPKLIKDVESIIESDIRGDPMSPLRWTCKSTRKIAEILSKRGYQISHSAVADLLHDLDYSLQANRKTLEGKDHPDRDKQFEYINKQVKRFQKQNNPVISVDTKKKELIGNHKNAGQEWRRKDNPRQVEVHDFIDKKSGVGKVVPYGVYDIFQNNGWVNVGLSHDTSEFAAASIRRWWIYMGNKVYGDRDSILICADSGGSNGYRVRLWKIELQKWANEVGWEISVCHYPPGTSKWNKIEHCLFSHITMNWRAQPLTSYEVAVKLIANTTTRKGLKVKAKLDKRKYPCKILITKEQMKGLNLQKHAFHGEWNYTIKPNK